MAKKKRAVFDFSLCVSCGICVQTCPVSCIELKEFSKPGDSNLYPALTDSCLGCGSCERACPMGMIHMAEAE